ncbi:MAG: hypothetical protein HQK73_05880 [Desulfamplus sp.]|nr:hypothetical protein [Desulfamplus sp.]MBF0411919.1 hypothetical protein [Desulfamplus sp.]
MQKITVFQQNGSAMSKIAGIKRFGGERFVLKVINIEEKLPHIIEDASKYLPKKIDADLVLDYLKHPDISTDLSRMCQKEGIPVIASGRKIAEGDVFTPSTCCMLSRHKSLGAYGELFGAPEINLTIKDGKVEKVDVVRGAPCGATWDAAKKIEGLDAEDAKIRYGLEVQFFCTANPAGWDPITGKSPVHIAADIHGAAFNKSMKKS